jgi:hypothetical protein
MYYCIILMKVENTTYALMLQGPFQWPFASTHTFDPMILMKSIHNLNWKAKEKLSQV